jgi:EmrB/QacA subfamily drug resistance transporter
MNTENSKINKHSILLLIAVALGGLMDGLDGSIVNIALPIIASDFGADTGSVSWIVIIYLLMVAGTILIFGNIASRGHIKKTLITGFALFTISSIACGFSVSLPMLIFARGVQGLGASMIIACAPIICVKFMPREIIGLSFGVLTAATSVGFAAGPAIGGVLTHFLSWNWIFFINIPIGIFAVLYCLKVIPKGDTVNSEPFDWIGSVLLFAAMACGTYVLERFPHAGLSSPLIIGILAVCIVSAVLLCVYELKTPRPLINIRVFKYFKVNAVISAFLIVQVIYCGLLYLIPFYLTNAAGVDSLVSGIYLLIPPLVTAVASIPASRISDNVGGRRWFMAASSAMLVVISLIYSVIVPEFGAIPLITALILMGFSIAAISGPGPGKIVEVMPKGDKELGSTIMMTCVYGGGVLGTALYAAIFTLLTSSGGHVISFAELPTDVFLYGFHLAMIIGAVISIAGVILSLVVRDNPEKS